MLDKSIKKTLVIGSGPIVIGQAAEFDYSGTRITSYNVCYTKLLRRASSESNRTIGDLHP